MSDYELRPNVNRPDIAPNHTTGSWNFGLWLLVVAIAIAVLFAVMFFADGGGSIDGGIDGSGAASDLLVPASPETAPVAVTPDPAATTPAPVAD